MITDGGVEDALSIPFGMLQQIGHLRLIALILLSIPFGMLLFNHTAYISTR